MMQQQPNFLSVSAWDNPFADWMELNPRVGYFSYQNQWGGQGASPNQRRYYQKAFSDIHDEYLARLGQQIRGGMAPTERFNDFLQSYPFTERYLQQPPELTGRSNFSRFAPRARFAFQGF